MDQLRVATDRAILDVLLARPGRHIDRDHDLLTNHEEDFHGRASRGVTWGPGNRSKSIAGRSLVVDVLVNDVPGAVVSLKNPQLRK